MPQQAGIALFVEMDGFGWTNVRASSTLCTQLRIDFVNITFGDSANRTFVYASPTCDAIVINYVSHSLIKFLNEFEAKVILF